MIYSAFKIARGFKVKSLYHPLHTHIVIHSQLRGAAQWYSYGIIEGRWERERERERKRERVADRDRERERERER